MIKYNTYQRIYVMIFNRNASNTLHNDIIYIHKILLISFQITLTIKMHNIIFIFAPTALLNEAYKVTLS